MVGVGARGGGKLRAVEARGRTGAHAASASRSVTVVVVVVVVIPRGEQLERDRVAVLWQEGRLVSWRGRGAGEEGGAGHGSFVCS